MASAKKKSVSRGQFCSAIGCTNSFYKEDCKGKSFFTFPRDEKRCAEWVQRMRREDIRGMSAEKLRRSRLHLCSDHFEKSQFLYPDKTNKLAWNAIPTVFKNVPNPPPRIESSRKPPKMQKTTKLSVEYVQPRKKKRIHFQGVRDVSVGLSADQTVPVSASEVGLAGTSNMQELEGCAPQLSPRKRKLKVARNKVYRLQKKLKMLKTQERQQSVVHKRKLLNDLSQFVTGPLLHFIKTQLTMVTKKKKGRRWSEHDKRIAISIFHASPKAYRLLQRLFLLPSVSTLRRVMQSIQVYPGFSRNILQALAEKVQSMPSGSECCVLLFDEMALKESVTYNVEKDYVEGLEDFGSLGRSMYVANHATVFMVRGLAQNWKQTVGYFLSSGPIGSKILHSLLIECLDYLAECGLNVKVVIADQGSNNRSVFDKFLKVTEDEPFFLHNGIKVYVMHDPPHLLKNIRNNLKSHGFIVDGKEIKWAHIEEFYNFDSANSIRLAPRLTRKHIDLPPFAALRVKFATQVLSRSVAAGISTLVGLHAMDEDAMFTAIFLKKFDELFNAFNSGSLRSTQVMGHALSASSGHEEFLRNSLAWLESVQPLTSHAKLPCLSGWKMAIRSLLSLWEELHTLHGFKFLLTNRLNQDCVENLFSMIRYKGGHSDNPSAERFRAFLRQAMVDQFFLKSASSNCTEDGDKWLVTLTNVMKNQDRINAAQPARPSIFSGSENDTDFFDFAFPAPVGQSQVQAEVKENILLYISGYIAKKVSDKPICTECKSTLVGSCTGSKSATFFSQKQIQGLSTGGLTYPSAALQNTVEMLEEKFKQTICKVLHMDRIQGRLLAVFEKLNLTVCCPQSKCKVRETVEHLFIKIRLNFFLKDNSRSFYEGKQKRNRKVMKMSHM